MKFYKLIIPKGFKGSAAEMSGGCGPEKSWFDLVPDHFIGVDISTPCKIHDFCYTIGGTEEDKIEADKMFHTNLVRTVKNDDSLIFREANLDLADLYYRMVRDHGHNYFNYSKSEKIT